MVHSMKKLPVKNILALLLALTLLLPLAIVPATAQQPAVLRVALLSDLHYYPPSMADGYSEFFKENNVGHPIEQAPGLLRSALAAIAARRDEVDYLLITGDLTRYGEYAGHTELTAILEQFEIDSGIEVAVVPGNHDVNAGAADFTGGVKRDAKKTTQEEFLAFYANLGYDLPGLERFTPAGDERAGMLSYAVDLGDSYRLIAIDTHMRRINPDLQAWAIKQCEEAVAAGKTVIGMGHHNLNEQLKGQLIIMQNQGIENMREVSEAFADAGMHFYFSGHLHMSEISPWYSDSGQVLYDIVVPGLFVFPGDYRVVTFTAADGRVDADIRSYAPDEILPLTANGITYPQPYQPIALGLTFGYGGEGLAGLAKINLKKSLLGPLEDLRRNGGIAAMVKDQVDLGPINALFEYLDERLVNQPDKILALVNGLVDDAFALPVSKLPCTRFIDEMGFGNRNRPGTVDDMANSAIVYMFWKKHDPKDDPFIQDALRRLQNGELLDQLLGFAVPKILDVLGAGVLPLIIDCQPVNRALGHALNTLNCPLVTILALALTPGMRDTLCGSLYGLASEIITSASPTGSGSGKIVYDGPVTAPTGKNTFRLPHDIRVTLSGDQKSAEITWYTKSSLVNPELKLTDVAGNAVSGVAITTSFEFEYITVNEIDLAIMKMLGTNMRAAKHTARLEGLTPGKAYKFTVGDSHYEWYSGPQNLPPEEESPFRAFLRKVWEWVLGMWKLLGIWWNNRVYLGI